MACRWGGNEERVCEFVCQRRVYGSRLSVFQVQCFVCKLVRDVALTVAVTVTVVVGIKRCRFNDVPLKWVRLRGRL